jgi:hypothetical protein
MKMRVLFVPILAFLVLGGLASCTESDNSGVEPPPSSTVVFKDIQTFLQKPSQVQFTFRISDSRNHAVVIDQGPLTAPFRIFEDGAEIDYSETSYFVHPAASLELDMVVLLDFTNSMASWQDSGRSGIDLEVNWTRDLIAQLAAAHRMAIMEYHDRNVDAGIIAPFSNDKTALNASLDQFLSQPLDHGSSRIWDALYSAVGEFDGGLGANKERSIFFITDGKETSSDRTPADVINSARLLQASIFIVGTGNVTNENSLKQIAEQTGGEYYPAGDMAAFQQKLQQITRDLGGQYKLSYITLKRSGSHDVQVKFAYNGLSGQFDSSLDLGSIYGDDRVGVLSFDSPTLTASGLHVIVRAQHVPRNIDRFRFKLATTKEYHLSLIAADAGGICSDWTISGADDQGYVAVSSTTPLLFGDFGPLFQIDISPIIETSVTIPFELDNSVYSEGKSFTFPANITWSAIGGGQP